MPTPNYDESDFALLREKLNGLIDDLAAEGWSDVELGVNMLAVGFSRAARTDGHLALHLMASLLEHICMLIDDEMAKLAVRQARNLAVRAFRLAERERCDEEPLN